MGMVLKRISMHNSWRDTWLQMIGGTMEIEIPRPTLTSDQIAKLELLSKRLANEGDGGNILDVRSIGELVTEIWSARQDVTALEKFAKQSPEIGGLRTNLDGRLEYALRIFCEAGLTIEDHVGVEFDPRTSDLLIRGYIVDVGASAVSVRRAYTPEIRLHGQRIVNAEVSVVGPPL